MDFFEKNNNFINTSPLIIYAITYLAGILTGIKFDCGLQANIYLLSLCAVLLPLLYYLVYVKKSLKNRVIFTIFLTLSFFIAGSSNISIRQYLSGSIEKSVLKNGEAHDLKIVLTENPKEYDNSYALTGRSIDFNEGVIIYTDKNIAAVGFRVGDTLYAAEYKGRVVEPPDHDDRFDYRSYLERKGIYSTAYIRSSRILAAGYGARSFKRRIDDLKISYMERIKKYISVDEGADALIAITTGDKSYLRESTRNAFGASGAMHLMAVSGLHAGFVFTFFSLILSFMGNSIPARIFRSLTIIITLLIYSAIAGFSPSVVRASLMLSILLLSDLCSKRNCPLNSLCASAIIICIFDPYAVLDAGFQLSYTAVLSILFINPALESGFKPRNAVLNYFLQDNICINIVPIRNNAAYGIHVRLFSHLFHACKYIADTVDRFDNLYRGCCNTHVIVRN